MTDTEINIAIAKCLGWTLGVVKEPSFRDPSKFIENTRWIDPDGNTFRRSIPDFTEDLNECAEMEATLDHDDSRFVYSNYLYKVVVPMHVQPFRASARQRCEAFLRMKGLWNE